MPFKGNHKQTRPYLPEELTPYNFSTYVYNFLITGSDQAIAFCRICQQLARTLKNKGDHSVQYMKLEEFQAFKDAVDSEDAGKTYESFIKLIVAYHTRTIEKAQAAMGFPCTRPIGPMVGINISEDIKKEMFEWAILCWRNPYRAILHFHAKHRYTKGIVKDTLLGDAKNMISQRLADLETKKLRIKRRFKEQRMERLREERRKQFNENKNPPLYQ